MFFATANGALVTVLDLPWWVYVLIGTIVFTSAFCGVWLASIAFDRETEDETYPCLAHLGTENNGTELWCWLQHGHSGRHLDQFGLEETVFTQEWPEDMHECVIPLNDEPFRMNNADLPPLPQRLSKGPVQPEHNRPWPGCFHQSSDGRCRLVKSHIGPHEYV